MTTATSSIVNNVRLTKDSDWKAWFTKARTEATTLHIWDILNPSLPDSTTPDSTNLLPIKKARAPSPEPVRPQRSVFTLQQKTMKTPSSTTNMTTKPGPQRTML